MTRGKPNSSCDADCSGERDKVRQDAPARWHGRRRCGRSQAQGRTRACSLRQRYHPARPRGRRLGLAGCRWGLGAGVLPAAPRSRRARLGRSASEFETGERNLDRLPASQFLKAVGKSAACGGWAPSTSTGMTGTPRSSAASISTRTKSCGSSSSSPARGIDARNPGLADNRHQRVAWADPLRQHVDEVAARRDGVDIEEDALVSEPADQPVVDPPGEAARILAPIADEHAA